MYNVRKDQQRINEIVSHKNIYYYLLKTSIHDMYISYIKTWIKKVSCIHIKHVKHIKKVCSLSQKWVFFHRKKYTLTHMQDRKSTTFSTNIWHHRCDGHKHVL